MFLLFPIFLEPIIAYTLQFFFHGQEDFSKVFDIEGWASEPLECGLYWMLWGTFSGIPD
jgi:hypothetical protein